MNKIYIILIGLIPVQLVGLIFIKNHPLLIEIYYSQKFYPILFDFYRFFFKKIPFSIGDIFYAIIIMHISYEIIMTFKRKKIKWVDTLKKTLSIFSIIFLAAHLYSRPELRCGILNFLESNFAAVDLPELLAPSTVKTKLLIFFDFKFTI